MTIAAEQGIIGLIAYGAVLFLAFQLHVRAGCAGPTAAGRRRCRRSGARSSPPAFTALVFHTMTYAAFLEDPITWTLIGLGIAIRLTPAASTSSSSDELLESPSERTRTASYSR